VFRKKIDIKSPVRVKDLEGRVGASLQALVDAQGSKTELYDTDRMNIIDVKKGECVALVDARGRFFELCRKENGRYTLTRLEDGR
jgi:dTDP-4-dehydrorhamnose 3,5-epimerase-like enzyme